MTSDKEILLNQYQTLCDLHKFYLNMVLSSALFVNVIISGVSVYIIDNNKDSSILILGLLFPIAISFSYSLILLKAKPKCVEFKEALARVVKEIDVEVGPHVSLTLDSISVFKVLYFLVGVALTILFLTRIVS